MMTISILNIDWASKQKNNSHVHKIEEVLQALDSDILIITEGVELNLPAYNYVYKTKQLPADQEYEGLNYTTYLHATPAYRAMIYSKYESSRSFGVTDEFTSVCQEFETEFGTFTIYATIVGTWFKKKVFAEKELSNCVEDCMLIYKETGSLCLAGDLNTSFGNLEGHLQISTETTRRLKEVCKSCKMDLTTGNIKENIDHILLPEKVTTQFDVSSAVFVAKGKFSDHPGITVTIKRNT